MKRVVLILWCLSCYIGATAQVSINDCQLLARDNYPLIKEYDLIRSSTAYSISSAKRSYLPQVSISGQATYQSDAMAFPEEMSGMFSQMGLDVGGLNKDQYRIGIDVSQNIWDGGRSKSQQEIYEAEGEVEMRSIEVEIYSIHERVNALYFGVLLLEEQLAQNRIQQELLESNYNKVGVLIKNGAAMQSDADAIRVEVLLVQQQYIQINTTSVAYRKMLALFTGKSSLTQDVLLKPIAKIPVIADINRSELKLLDAQYSVIEAQKQSINSSIKPTFGAFATSFYGNPGLNSFKDMVDNKFTFNYVVGLKMQWKWNA